MEIPFLHYLSSVKSLKCKTVSRYFLLPIMGANFAIWLYTFLDETQIIQLYNYDYPTEAYVYNISVACQNHSSVTEIYMRSSMYKIFYPLSMEFCIASLEILHFVYVAPVVLENSPEAVEYSAQTLDDALQKLQSLADAKQKVQLVSFHSLENSPLPNAAGHSEPNAEMNRSTDNYEIQIKATKPHGEHPSLTRSEKIFEYCLIIFHPCTALLQCLTEASLMQIALLHDDVVKYHYISNHYLYAVCQIPMMAFRVFTNCLPLLFATSFCLWVVQSFKQKRKWSTNNFGLLLGFLGSIVVNVYKIAVCFLKMKKNTFDGFNEAEQGWTYSLCLIESTSYMAQYLLQVRHLFSTSLLSQIMELLKLCSY